MVRRECLSVFSAVYKYIRSENPSGSLWRSAQREILQASSILPLMCTSLDLPWSSTIVATDSSEVGYGVCERVWTVRVPHQLAGLVNSGGTLLMELFRPGLTRSDTLDEGERYDCARVCNSDFKEVGATVLDPSAWHVVFSGVWQHRENILRTEGRAMLSGVRHLLRCRRHAGLRHVLLVDNLALALACNKGRGSSSLTNGTCQQLCALALASDSKFHVRWIPSERSCADRPSREPWLKTVCATAPVAPAPGDGLVDPYAGDGLGDAKAPSNCSPAYCGPSEQEAALDGAQCGSDRASSPGGRLPFGGQQGAEGDTGSLQHHCGDLPVLQCLTGLRLAPHCVPQRAICTGSRRVRRGVHFRRLAVPVPRLRKVRLQDFGPGHPGPRGLPKLGCTQDAASNTSCGFRGYRGGPLCDRQPRAGFGSTTSMGSALTAWRAHKPAPASGSGASISGGDAQRGIVLAPSTGGSDDPSKTNVFDESILLSPRVDYLLPALAALAASRKQMPFLFDLACTQLNVAFRHGRPSQVGCVGSHTLREPSWGSQRAPSLGDSAQRDQSSRALASRLKSEAVREGHGRSAAGPQGPIGHPALRQLRGKPAQTLRQPPSKSCVLQQCNGPEPASPALPASPQRVTLDRQIHKHLHNLLHQAKKLAQQNSSQVFLELFSGSGAIARHLRRQGFGVVALDTRNSVLEDLCHPATLQVLRGWISSGVVLGVWLGTPCTSWSIAHTTPVVRTRKFILGVPGLSGKHKHSVELGNATAKVTAQMISACLASCVPCFLENPQTSKLFLAPCIRVLRQHPQCQEFISDYCQYGTPWRKSTKVCTWFSSSCAPQQRCQGRNGFCSRTQVHHIALSGKSPQHVSWTRIAEPYPCRWAKAWATVVSESATNCIALRLALLANIL